MTDIFCVFGKMFKFFKKTFFPVEIENVSKMYVFNAI